MIVTTHARRRIVERLGDNLTAAQIADLWRHGRPYDTKRDRWTFRPTISPNFEYRVACYRGRNVLLVCALDAEDDVLVSMYAEPGRRGR